MSFLMFAVGIVAVVIGVVLIAAGVPVKEFSFGNTLILAGTVAATGGLIVTGLAAVIAQLQRVTDMLGTRPAGRTTRSLEAFDQAGGRVEGLGQGLGQTLGQGPGKIPFPSKPKTAPAGLSTSAPVSEREAEEPHEEPADVSFAPSLRNPELTFADAEAEEAPLMAKASNWAPQFGGRGGNEFSEPAWPAPTLGANGAGASRPMTAPDSGWRAPAASPRLSPQPNYFDAMWPNDRPAETHSTKSMQADDKPLRAEPGMRDPALRESVLREPAVPKRPDIAAQSSPSISETRAVPILKSGVIDGMGYTLFVDGSIEAELPQGTLRFASIGELREHLEKSA